MRPRLFLLAALGFASINCFGQGIVSPRRARALNRPAEAGAPAGVQHQQTTQPPGRVEDARLPAALAVSAIKINARIDGQVATVRVEHLFHNDTDDVLEGTYYYPVPEGATLVEFAVWDGDERRVGRVKEKEEARAAYSAAVAQGEDPAILEMTRRGWFQSRINPIPPHADKRVELVYTQLLQAKNGSVTFEYPLGKGYKKLKVPVGAVTIAIDLRSTAAITTVFSPTHVMDIERDGDHHATCKAETAGGGKAENFQLSYSLSNEDVNASLITYRKKGEDGYFLLMLSPKVDFDQRRISAKDTLFVIDVSGSMDGDKLKQAKEALRFGLTKTLNETDSFNIIAFESRVSSLSARLVQCNRANIERGLDFVDRLRAGGGTNINEALVTAMGMFERNNRPHNLVFVTDGEATEGVTGPGQIAANVRGANTARARLFSFGVGQDFNRLLLERLAAENRGVGSNIEDQSQLGRTVSTFFSKVSQPVLSDLSVDFGPVLVDRVHPRELPDLYTRSQIRIFGRYQNAEELKDVTVSLTGKMNGQNERFEFAGLYFPLATADDDTLPKLWATERVNALLEQIRLNGEMPELKQEVIDLAREFNLVTPYTSMYVPTSAEAAQEKQQQVERDQALKQQYKKWLEEDVLYITTDQEKAALADNSPRTTTPGAAGAGTGGGVGTGNGGGAGSTVSRRVQALPGAPGAVSDVNGAAIAGATVTIKDSATGTTRVVRTDENGNYSVAGLPPGKYNVQVDANGFQRVEVTGVSVQPGQTIGASVQVPVGTVSETVNVAAVATTVDQSGSQISSSQEKNEIRHLPNLGAVDSLIRLAPGASASGSQQNIGNVTASKGPEFRIWTSSPRARSNAFTIDGQNNTAIDGQAAVSLNTPDAVDSLRILSTRGSGDLSPFGASAVNVITRAGTNEFHGGVFDYYLNRRFGAMSPFERRNGLDTPPLFKTNLLGGTIGGPLRPDRAFFFASLARDTMTSLDFVDSTASLLTPTASGLETLSLLFPNSTTVRDLIARGPLGRPGTGLSLNRRFLLPVLGTPIEFGELTRQLASNGSGYDATGRLDVALNPRDRLQGGYWYDGRDVSNGAGRLASGYASNHASRGQLGNVKWNRSISPRAVNDLALNFNRSSLSLDPAANDLPLPSVGAGPLSLSYGRDSFALAHQTSTLFEVNDGLTHVAGRHSIKLGAQVSRRITRFDFLPGAGGSFSYPSVEDFILDRPAAIVVAYGDPQSQFSEWRGHMYADDAWRLSRDLTLTLGLSYEVSNQPINQLGDKLRKRESSAANALFDSALPMALRAMPRVDADLNNVSPRIGFAYTPGSRVFGRDLFGAEQTVVHGGVSVSHDQTAYRPLADVAGSAPNVLAATLTRGGPLALPPFPHLPEAATLSASLGRDPRNFARTQLAPGYRTPTAMNWHFGITREFNGEASVEVDYVGYRGSSLIRSIDGSPQPASALAESGGPFRIYENSGHSIYHSLQARADIRLRNSFSGGVSYTFGKLIDDVPENNLLFTGGVGNPAAIAVHALQSFAQNPLDDSGGERALSALDRRHALSAHFVWELPMHWRSGLLARLLNGWKSSGIAEVSSGSPYTPLQYFGSVGTTSLFASIFSDRFGAIRPFAGNAEAPADAVAFSNAANAFYHFFTNADGSPFVSPTGFVIADRSGFRAGTPDNARFIYNDYAVEQAAAARGLAPDAFGKTFANGRQFGDVGRNSLIGPGLVNFDLAIFKTTKLSERVSLEIRGEMFNAFNHPNRSVPDAILERAGGHGFADLGGVDASPRRVRFALKLTF